MNLANRITLSRLFLIPIFMLFTTEIPSYIDKVFNFQVFDDYGMYIATGIFIIAAITDKLDGYIARKYNQITKFGVFLDPLVDKLLITGALLLLVQFQKTPWWMAVVIIVREFAVTGFRLAAVKKGIVLPADKLGKIKMVFQVVAIVMTMLNNYPLSLISEFRFDILMMFIATILTLYSGINYFMANRNVFHEDDRCINKV